LETVLKCYFGHFRVAPLRRKSVALLRRSLTIGIEFIGHELLWDIQGHGCMAHEHIFLRGAAIENADLRIEAPFFKCLGGRYIKPERHLLAFGNFERIESGSGRTGDGPKCNGALVCRTSDENEGDAQQAINSRQGFFMSSPFGGCDASCQSRIFLKFFVNKGEI